MPAHAGVEVIRPGLRDRLQARADGGDIDAAEAIEALDEMAKTLALVNAGSSVWCGRCWMRGEDRQPAEVRA